MALTKREIKTHLLNAGVKNLKEFGYPEVNSENILTDDVYSEFFKNMLNENKGHSQSIDDVINELIKEIETKKIK